MHQDTIGSARLDADGTLVIDLDPPVRKEHAHIVRKPADQDYAYLLAQAGSPKPGETKPFRRATGKVTMNEDRSLTVDLNGGVSHGWHGLHAQQRIAPGDSDYVALLDRVGPMEPQEVRPLVGD